jgi:hypothetical protein
MQNKNFQPQMSQMSTDKKAMNPDLNPSVHSVKSVVKLFSHYASVATQITATQALSGWGQSPPVPD